MKTLQNNFTTPEQSKRLLEIGVPSDSADLYYQDYGSIPMVVWTLTQPHGLRRGILKPCWSVGRLFEIIAICLPAEIVISTDEYPYVLDNILQVIEDCIEEFNFSKLED